MVRTVKKAQMEVFGLAMVVILIFIGMVLVVVLYKPSSSSDLRAAYSDEVIAQNMITAMFNLNTTCSLDMEELAKNCHLSNSYLCDGKYACEYFQDIASNIFENTLEVWKEPYTFEIEETPIQLSYGNCSTYKKVPGTHHIPLSPQGQGSITAFLYICRS